VVGGVLTEMINEAFHCCSSVRVARSCPAAVLGSVS